MKLGLRKDSTNSSALVLTTDFTESGTFGFGGFGGTYIQRFFVAILAPFPSLILPIHRSPQNTRAPEGHDLPRRQRNRLPRLGDFCLYELTFNEIL